MRNTNIFQRFEVFLVLNIRDPVYPRVAPDEGC
jgi:hypothetical protein